MRLASIALGFAVALLSSGCGPWLRQVKDFDAEYRSNLDCAQGPFELEGRTLGSRWGEYVELSVRSPRALHGWYRLSVDGKTVSSGPWQTGRSIEEGRGSRFVVDAAPENARCLARPAPPAPEAASMETAPVERAELPARPDTRAFDPIPFPETRVLEGPRLVEAGDSRRDGPHFAQILRWEARNESLSPPKLQPDRPMLLELWSELPNDLQGAVFFFEHGRLQPSGTEEEWIAELHKREADWIRESYRRSVDARHRREREERELAEHARRCREHPDARECQPQVVAVAAPVRPPPATPVRVAPATPPPPQPRPPPGPPPPPQEEVPAAPSTYVQWVPGYWHWTGFEWAWLEGWWKVDERARAAAEAAATRPAPVARVETPPPPPCEGVVWRAGLWLWSGSVWHWQPGGWMLHTGSAPQQKVHPADAVDRRQR